MKSLKLMVIAGAVFSLLLLSSRSMESQNNVKTLKDAIKYGEKLWNDTSLGKSGMSCNTCHQGGKNFKETVKQPYPHYVNMPKRVVTLDQMINFCMMAPMKTKPLAWDSEEITALSAYIQNVVLKEVKKVHSSHPLK